MTGKDYVVVGGGSAGCVLVERLSVDPKNNVLLLEAGPEDSSPLIHMPRGSAKLYTDPRHIWLFQTEARDGLPAETWIRGKTLGGSSSINGMVYFRGQPEDYDGWEQLGATGWGWAQMGPSFCEIEAHELGADGVRGGDGPLGISIARDRSPFTEAFIHAGQQMGLRLVEDLNRPEQGGVGYIPRTISRGRRQSSAVAFLKPARQRRNLRVMTEVTVDRLLFEGKRVSGVVGRERGKPREFLTTGEVILSAGALNTPLILERSGIGNAERLRQLAIDVVTHSPGVGEHLLEHRILMVRHDMTMPYSDNREYRGLRLAANVMRYYLARSGALATGHASVGAFVCAHPESAIPDSEILLMPVVAQANANGQFETEIQHSAQVFGYPLRSRSEGSIHIRSSDPLDPPTIRAAYLEDDYDKKITVAMHRYIRRWLAQPAIAGMIGPERDPTRALETDEEIIAGYRTLGASGAHACGTCRMGNFKDAVIDERLRVRGVEGLRVVDGSIMPSMVSANTNGPIMASAWRASKLILEDRYASASA